MCGREKIDIIKSRLIKNFGYNEVSATDVLNYVASIFARGDAKKALQLHAKFYPVFKDLFIETNPVPVKAALVMLGVISEEYRLPLVSMTAANRAKLQATLKACGILK